jgi:polysaccharide export outer membrane protein
MNLKGETRGFSYYITILFVFWASHVGVLSAQTEYKIQPGDTLTISVWKEPDLTGDVVVHPDGTFTVPLVGEVVASNRSIVEIQKDIADGLIRYIPEPVVTIGLKATVGNKIYIIGQVNEPGAYTVTQPTDVMQALSLAQGMTAYASENKIRILRRNNDEQIAIDFRYGDVAKGKNLQQNILLKNGDVVVVP